MWLLSWSVRRLHRQETDHQLDASWRQHQVIWRGIKSDIEGALSNTRIQVAVPAEQMEETPPP